MKKRLWMLLPLACFIALLVVFIKDVIEIVPALNGGEDQLAEALSGLGIRGAITLVLIQASQMLLVFIPSEPIQVVAGATYGMWWGILVCWGGLLLGATIIYLLVNVLKMKTDNMVKTNASFGLISRISKRQRSAFMVTLILFFLPAIPYGIICYFASGTKIKFHWYILCCMIGVLPSVLLTTVLGSVIIGLISRFLWPVLIAFVVVMVAFLWLVSWYSKRKLNKMMYGEPKPLFDRVLSNRNVQKPDEGKFDMVYKLMKTYFGKKNNVKIYNDEIKELKPPYIVLSTHPSKPDFVYSCMSIAPIQPNIVANRYYFNNPILFKQFTKLGIIPKKLFTADTQCIKDMMKVIKNEGVVVMMPEGRLSIDGTNKEMPKGLGKLLKKLNVPVVLTKPHGAYLTGGKWMKTRRKGEIEVENKILFAPEQLAEMTAEEIDNKTYEEMAYDDFEWNKEKQIEYKGRNLLKGIEGILYICPNCNSQFSLKGHKNHIKCKHCGSVTHMNNKYEFTNPPIEGINNIRDWYNYQVEVEKQNIVRDDFVLSCEVKAKTYNKYGNGFDTIGKGLCIFNKDGLTYTTVKGKAHTAHVSCQDLSTLLFGCQEDFETYIDDKFYYFVPLKDKKVCVKWSICSELMHKHLLENITKNDGE